MKSKTRSVLQNLALLVLSPLVFFGLLEGVLRVTGWSPVVPVGRYDTRRYDPVRQWRLIPGRGIGVPGVIINSLGFIGHEFSREKPAGTYRIICLGDSVTYGAWNEGPRKLRFHKPYPEQLESLLRSAYKRRKLEVINAGVYGYTSFLGYRYLRTELLDLKPDLITILFGWNDMFQRFTAKEEEFDPENPILRDLQYALFRTRIYRVAALLLRKEHVTKPPGKAASSHPSRYAPRVSVDHFERDIRDMVLLARRHNVRVILLAPAVGPPPPEQTEQEKADWALDWIGAYVGLDSYGEMRSLLDKYVSAARKVATEEHVPFIDLQRAFDDNSKWFPGDRLFGGWDLIHPTTAGHMVIAREIRNVIMDEKLLAGNN